MNNDLTRKYNLPTPVSHSTALIVEQYKQAIRHSDNNSDNTSTPTNNNSITNTNTTTNIPELQDLLSMKADLEVILPVSENRVKDLKKDLNYLDRSVKIRDNGAAGETTSGKNMNMVIEKMKIKQESDETSEDLHSSSSSSIPKNGMNRKDALDYIKRRRRREETESLDDLGRRGRSESPHHIVKIKKLDNIPPHTSQSMSPTPTPSTPKSTSASTTSTELKKKKSSNNAHAQHPLSNGIASTSSEHGKQHTKQQKPSNNNNTTREEVDFVRVKPKDQVPITAFWTALEPYFRTLTEEDRAFLLEKGDNGKPYLIPPLGPFYLEQWAEEDQGLGISSHTRSPSSNNNNISSRQGSVDPTSQVANNSNNKLKYVQHDITDDILLQNDISCGSLTERLISSLLAEDLIDPSEAVKIEQQHSDDLVGDEENNDPMSDVEIPSYNNKQQGKQQHYGKTIVELASDPTEEIVGFEERLKRELQYAGLFGEEEMDFDAKEDDEISAELRTLQRELKYQVKQNDYRKKTLLEVVDTHLAFEQYRQVLDNLDSQVEQGYMKRFRPQKSKKRKSTGPKTMLSENAVYAMEKRKIWKSSLGPIFSEKNMMMPFSSIYKEPSPPDDNAPLTSTTNPSA